MKSGTAIIGIGIIMFIIGLIAFYSIQNGHEDEFLLSIKNAGTFIGLMGIGVAVAGVLLYLINRGQATPPQTFDV